MNRYEIVKFQHEPEKHLIVDKGVVRHGAHVILFEGTKEECWDYQIKHNLFENLKEEVK